jgi:protein-tyrosine phosphatase
MSEPLYRVTFVCMGNICRSPTAHGVFRQKLAQVGRAQQVIVDSAGTHDYHAGEPPDERSQQHAAQRGYDLSDLRARQIEALDFETADLLLVMDWDNFALTRALCPPQHLHKVRRLTEFCQRQISPVVPDPYAGGAAGFERVLDLIEDACEGLLAHVAQQAQAVALAARGPVTR